MITNLVVDNFDDVFDGCFDESTNTADFSNVILVDEGVLTVFGLFGIVVLYILHRYLTICKQKRAEKAKKCTEKLLVNVKEVTNFR